MIDIDPNTNGLPGIEQLRIIVGSVMTIGLILAVLSRVRRERFKLAPDRSRQARRPCLVGAEILGGAAVMLVKFFWNVGQTV